MTHTDRYIVTEKLIEKIVIEMTERGLSKSGEGLGKLLRSRPLSRCVSCKHNSGMPNHPCTILLERYPDSLQIGIPFYIDILGCGSYEV